MTAPKSPSEAVREADDTAFDDGPAFVPGGRDASVVDPDDGQDRKPLTPEQVKAKLRKGTGKINEAAGAKVGADLQMTEFEAELIAPGLADYANRVPVVAMVLEGGPERARMAAGFGLYGWRVSGDVIEARRERAKAGAAPLQQQHPVTGDALPEPPPEQAVGTEEPPLVYQGPTVTEAAPWDGARELQDLFDA